MQVKVQCDCGARFEFEVEPLNGEMPVGLNCPTCGASVTHLANAVIRQQLGQAVAPVAPVVASVPIPPPASSGLRISKSAHAAPATPAPTAQPATPAGEGVVMCPKHMTEPAVDNCKVCGKPICPICMEQFGYVCSVYCRQQAIQKRMTIPKFAGQKDIGADKTFAVFRTLVYIGIFLAVLVFGFWGWYGWFARNPKVVYWLPIPVSTSHFQAGEYYQLIGPGQLLSVKGKHAGLYDITKQTQVWNTPLQTDAEAAATKGDADYKLSEPLVAVTTNDLWLTFRDRVIHLDRRSGERKEPTIWGRILNSSSDTNALMVAYVSPEGQRKLSRVNLSDGTVQTADLDVKTNAPKSAPAAVAKKGTTHTNAAVASPATGNATGDKGVVALAAIKRKLRADAEANGANLTAGSKIPGDLLDEPDSETFYDAVASPFVLAGENVIQFNSKLLEQKIATHESVKPKGKSVLDSGNVTASQGMDLAQEMLNDSAREQTGGVEVEDVSRYQVTLHRWFASDAPDWTGEVIGPPAVYSLKTVDLLVAGQSLTVFDKHNKKLWAGKLTYAPHASVRPPCLETGDTLYFADTGGLIRFNLATGNVRWRMDSVGIASIVEDAKHNLYLASTTATPDHITHPHQVNVHDKIHPLIMKVNPDSGRVVWQTEADGAECFMSGKFFYTTWVTRTQSVYRLEEGPDAHYNLFLIDPATGNEIWEYHKTNHPVQKTQLLNNWILLQYEDGVSVLKFFSL